MHLIPEPHFIHFCDSQFILSYDCIISLQPTLGFKELNYAKILKAKIKSILGYSLVINKSSSIKKGSIHLSIHKQQNEEEYQIIVDTEKIEIIAGSTSSLLYGIQTLSQIIAQTGPVIHCLIIKDYPELKIRGFYHDVTRGRIPSLESLKALADKLSYYKMNQLQLYIEHSFLFSNLSEVWRDDTPITAAEILELDRYCDDLNIELIPSIASFGHLYKILSTKTYSNLCELENADKMDFSFVGRMEHHTVDVTNEESFQLITDIIKEYMDLFHSPYFNICADETFDLGKGRSKNVADEIGTGKLYINYLIKLCSFLKEHDKKPMFWGDIILAKPEVINELPEDVICLNWDYNPDLKEDNVRMLHELGVKQYLCPGVQGWRRVMNRNDYAYENISKMCLYAHKYKAMGILNTDWGDYGHLNHPEFSTTGMIYGAAFSWNQKTFSLEEINRKISVLEYKDRSGEFVKVITQMEKQEVFLWESVVEFKEFIQFQNDNKARELMNKLSLDTLKVANENLVKEINKLYQLINEMDTSKRGEVKAYLIAAKGILLFNTLASIIGRCYYHMGNELLLTPDKLAVELEFWFQDYKKLWRSYGKEAELYRIQEVINWYGDFLRDLKRESL